MNKPERKEGNELSVNDVAAFCNVHKATVWRWIKAGKLEAHRMETDEKRRNSGKGVNWLIYASDLVEFMEKRNEVKNDF